MPFQIAQRDALPCGYTTAYNRVKNLHASGKPKLLQDILRGERGFDGMVMSDWWVVLFSHHTPFFTSFEVRHVLDHNRSKLALI